MIVNVPKVFVPYSPSRCQNIRYASWLILSAPFSAESSMESCSNMPCSGRNVSVMGYLFSSSL